MVTVIVNPKNPEDAIGRVKRGLQRELIFRKMREERAFIPNSEKRKRAMEEAKRRMHKMRKRKREDNA